MKTAGRRTNTLGWPVVEPVKSRFSMGGRTDARL
jgi:hypothetical protein